MIHLFCQNCRGHFPYPGPEADTGDISYMPEHSGHTGIFMRLEPNDDLQRLFDAWWAAVVTGKPFKYTPDRPVPGQPGSIPSQR